MSGRTGTKALIVALGVIGSGLVTGAVLFGLKTYDELRVGRENARAKASQSAASVQSAREKRTKTVVAVAPASLPTQLPLVPRDGDDAFGYPRSYVDGPALRSLLHFDKFAELSKYFEEFQQKFEADHKKEMWPTFAAETFASAEPELLPKLEAWVRATPDSFAPYLALGSHWTAVAYKRRGTKFAAETARQDFDAMYEAVKHARRNLQQALFKNPRLLAAQRMAMRLGAGTSERELVDQALAQSLKVCPECFAIRVSYLFGLQPRWGGSFEAMAGFAQAAPVAKNAKLKLLPGYQLIEKSHVAREAERLDEALSAANAACELGPHADFLEERAEVWMAKLDFERAQRDLDDALELRPELSGVRMTRAELFVKKQAWEAAASDVLSVMRVDPTANGARWAAESAAWGLDHDAWAAHQRGDHAAALRLFDLAVQLVPFDRGVLQRRSAAVQAGITGKPEEIAELEKAARALPDDFGVHQRLDYALAQQRSFPRVIEMWSEYLSRHPNDGRALLERSGAYYNSGKRDQARADATRACDLGVSQACAYQRL
jgi:tetratricopeptide (TPR) repeat protein